MDIKVELLKEYIADYINQHINDFEIDEDKIADSTAIKIVKEISGVLKNEAYDDIDKVEQFVRIFEKYGIDTGACHDY
ncbi:MAG: hypothetical protein IJE46_06180 [Clostridia bacterium]|nr:hypothetical protein [Clostridia bacterium]